MSKVVAVRIPPKPFDEEVLEAVRSAIDLLGGPKSFSRPGDSVLVKPNFCSSNFAAAVDLRFPWAVAAVFREAGCEVAIAENPVVNVSSRELFSSPHVGELRSKSGVEVVNLRAEDMVEVQVPNSKSCGTMSFSKRVLEADHVVGVPGMRRHPMTGVTLSIKNLYGTVAPSTRHRVHRASLSWGLVEIGKIVRQHLVVMDGSNIVCNGSLIPLGYVFASADPVAIDSVAATCMGFDPSKIEHIRYASEEGLGIMDLDMIELIGITKDEVRELGQKNKDKVLTWPDPMELAKEIEGVEVVIGNPCDTCVRTLSTALQDLRHEKIEGGPEVAILIGPEAMPIRGKHNILAGGCLRKLSDSGFFVDFCPAYANDIKSAVKYAKGLSKSFEYMWDEILRTREKDLPGA